MKAVFSGFGKDGARWPQWHVALETVHRYCGQELRRKRMGNRTTVAAPPPPNFSRDGDDISLPASMVHGALSALSTSDRQILWETLMGINTDSADWEPLSDALRRLEIAIGNEDIPSEGVPD